MNSRTRFCSCALAVLVALSSLTAAQLYTVTSVGNLGVGSGGDAYAINNRGEVAGVSNTNDGHHHAFFWTSTEGAIDLGVLPGTTYSAAASLNDSGQVVGWCENPQEGVDHAFFWSAKTGMKELGGLGGSTVASSINDSGEVTGYSTLLNGYTHTFLWTATGGMQDLGTLGGSYSFAGVINSSGEIAGESYLPGDAAYHAYLWTRTGGMQDLGTLGSDNSGASAINNAGHIVGTLFGPWGESAFIWTPAQGMQSLNDGPKSTYVGVTGINNSDEVAGYDGSSVQSAYVWQKPNHLTQLVNILTPTSKAYAINQSGQIAATDAILGAVLLTPVAH